MSSVISIIFFYSAELCSTFATVSRPVSRSVQFGLCKCLYVNCSLRVGIKLSIFILYIYTAVQLALFAFIFRPDGKRYSWGLYFQFNLSYKSRVYTLHIHTPSHTRTHTLTIQYLCVIYDPQQLHELHNMQQLAVADDSVEGNSRSSDKTYVYMIYFFQTISPA